MRNSQRSIPGKLRVLAWAFFVLLFISTAAVQAQNPAASSVTGVVIDEDSEPLEGAGILLYAEGSSLQRYGTAAGTEGAFSLNGVQPGRYQLRASFIGYAEHIMPIEVQPGSRLEVEVRLAERALSQPDVVVMATRAKAQLTPITFSNLTAADLEELPDMKDLPVLLSTLPSITYYSENGNGIGYSTMRMRGFDQRRLAVSINGIPQNDPEDHNVFWINFFDVQGAIQDIQVQRGAGSAFYGPTAIGGAVNIVAFPYKPFPYAMTEIGYGAYDTQRYTLEANTGLLNNRYVAYGRFSRLLTEGYRDWSWSRFYRFFAGLVRYGNHSTLTIQAYGGPQRDGLAYSGVAKETNGDEDARRSNFSSLTEDVEYFHQPHLELFHDWNPSNNATLHQALFWVKGEGYFDFGGTFRSADYLRLPGGFRRLDAQQRTLPLFITAPDASVLFRAYLDQWQVGWLPRLTFRRSTGETSLGAEARLHRSLRWGRIEEASGLPEHLVGPEQDVKVYQFHGEKAIASLYGSHLTRPLDWLAVQGDVQMTYSRYRHYEEQFFSRSFRKPYLFVNPRLGVTFNPEHAVSGYLSIALAHREPRLKSLYDGEEAGSGFLPQFERNRDNSFDYDNPLVKPERLVDLEVGGSINRERYRITGTAYLMDFRNEIVPSGGLDQFGVPRTGNADHSRHIGVELEGIARLGAGLGVQANATLSRNRFVRFTEFNVESDASTAGTERDGNPIAGFPDHIANLGLTYSRSGLAASLNAKYTGRQYIDNSGGKDPGGAHNSDLEIAPFVLLNASMQYGFSARSALSGLKLALDVNNLLDEKVLLYGNVGPAGPQFFPAATRHLFASLQYTLR